MRLSAEGQGAIFLAEDTTNGKIFTLPWPLALAVHRMKAATLGVPGARDHLDENAAKDAYGFLFSMQSMRDAETLKRKPFNPIFMQVPLFDVGPWQRYLQGAARLAVSWGMLVLFLLLAAIAFTLGVRNEWSILSVFDTLFSLEALITFGLIAPFLKIVHELGHVLVATYAGVRVRKAGLFFVGLYPMPFVDCTEADLTARRTHRIMISLAGLAVDITIGLIAFVAWYLVEGDYLRTLMGNIFLFSTLNSVLFNANPLIKLDGYYALVDLLGTRNLYTRSAKTFADLRSYIASFGADGALPRSLSHWGLIAYAVGALGYRFYIIFVIASALIPRYLGAGAAITAWGAAVMFLSPMLQDRAVHSKKPTNVALRTWGFRFALLSGLSLALIFIQLPFRTVVPLRLDVAGTYAVTIDAPGFLMDAPKGGQVQKGQTLAALQNSLLTDELAIALQNVRAAELAREAVQGESAVKTLAAEQSLQNYVEQVAILERAQENLIRLSDESGVFLPSFPLQPGQFLEPGQTIGALFPETGSAQMIGPFPERYLEKFANGVEQITLKVGADYVDLPAGSVELVAVITQSAETGTRSYQLVLRHDKPASEMVGKPGDVRLQFPSEPLWAHVEFFWSGLVVAFREAQLLDREKLLQDR